jgi:hypothetical protein
LNGRECQHHHRTLAGAERCLAHYWSLMDIPARTSVGRIHRYECGKEASLFWLEHRMVGLTPG